MNLESIVKALRVMGQADKILAEMAMRRAIVKIALGMCAALLIGFGLMMLEIAAYFFLVQFWTAISAAIALVAANFSLAALLLLIAAHTGESHSRKMALALHTSALDALQLEARAFDRGRLPTQAIGAALPALVVPAIRLLVQALQRRSGRSAGSGT